VLLMHARVGHVRTATSEGSVHVKHLRCALLALQARLTHSWDGCCWGGMCVPVESPANTAANTAAHTCTHSCDAACGRLQLKVCERFNFSFGQVALINLFAPQG